jgi:hypothetical protein
MRIHTEGFKPFSSFGSPIASISICAEKSIKAMRGGAIKTYSPLYDLPHISQSCQRL